MNLLLNKHTKQHIESFLENPSHALGIVGESGSGKLTITKYIASNLLTVQVEKITASPYVLMLDANKIGIDEVRGIQNFLKLTVPGSQALKRAIIIENTENLSQEATNALLKTLEEPPKDTIIICLINQKDKVPATVLSRLQLINVLSVSLDEALSFFKTDYSSEQVKKAYSISDGSAGLLSSLLRDDKEHPLIKAILKAKTILSLKKHERIAAIDKVIKDKDLEVGQFLDAVFRILEANYKTYRQTTNDASAIRLAHKRVLASEESLRDYKDNVQPKLLLTRLFMQL